VVVTDIVLPGLSGVELLKAIRAAAPDVQVIMMTGEPTVESAAESVRAGACDYLSKPVAKTAILRSVATAAHIKQIVDEKRRLEEANRQYQQNLEKLVAERTQALQDANQRLEAALVELQRNQDEIIKQERLNALGQMIGGIAHDFNNALMPIMGYASLLLSDSDTRNNPDQLQADLKTIRSAATAAADIVRRLREFYRPEVALGTTSVDLGKLVDRVMLLTEPAWKVQAETEGRNICIVNDIRDFPPIPANEPRLREALVNLVLNAVDAMPKGGTVRLSAECDAETVTLRVSDTGAGMSDDVRKRCFEPFFTTKGKRGSGLGLAIVYGIVTRHGGQIAVESEKDKGTTFVIRLPLVARETTPQEKALAIPFGRPAPVLNVLVVDDEEWARVLVQRFLTLKGHAVLTAASGHEALETFRRQPVDLVITDRAMPDLSGDRVAAAIKRLSPTTPVIMLTGFGDIMDVRQEKPAGVDYVLGKPVTPDQLQEAVIHTMGDRPSRGRAASTAGMGGKTEGRGAT
jgi:signal transduction histidine kinase